VPDGLEVKYYDPAKLIPYAGNARTHSEDQVTMIAASIKEFGFTQPILIDDDMGIVAGHGRVQAAQLLGLKQVPTIRLSGLTDAQRRAYVIADNQLATQAGWDKEMLKAELGRLLDDDFEIGLLGFSDVELGAIMADRNQGRTDPDDVPGLRAEVVSAPGDVWRLGRHVLKVGDATSADDVADALAGVVPHLMVTDPPYGVSYDPSWRAETKRSDGTPVSTGNVATGEVSNDDRADWREAWALFPGDVAYVWHGALHAQVVADSLIATGLEIRSQIIWVKPRAPISRGNYHWRHEPCWYAVRKGKTGHWEGGRKQNTVWEIDNNDGANHDREHATGHGTQKPVDLIRRSVENNSSAGQAVYEPFAGSGTTLIACEMTGRACHALEIDPRYADVIIRRWQDFTGEKAHLGRADGQTFEDIEHERGQGARTD